MSKPKRAMLSACKLATSELHVRAFLNGRITTGRLLKLVPSPRDLIGCFGNIIDEERASCRCCPTENPSAGERYLLTQCKKVRAAKGKV